MHKLLVLFVLTVIVQAQRPEIMPWEKLGLSSQEYKEAKAYHISDEKIKFIVSSGVSIRTHLSQPWARYGISEEKWYTYVRKGFDHYRIKEEVERKHRIRNLFKRKK